MINKIKKKEETKLCETKLKLQKKRNFIKTKRFKKPNFINEFQKN